MSSMGVPSQAVPATLPVAGCSCNSMSCCAGALLAFLAWPSLAHYATRRDKFLALGSPEHEESNKSPVVAVDPSRAVDMLHICGQLVAHSCAMTTRSASPQVTTEPLRSLQDSPILACTRQIAATSIECLYIRPWCGRRPSNAILMPSSRIFLCSQTALFLKKTLILILPDRSGLM